MVEDGEEGVCGETAEEEERRRRRLKKKREYERYQHRWREEKLKEGTKSSH